MRREREEKEAKEGKLYKIKEEIFRATRAIYIEPLASRPPPIFWKSNESFRGGRDVESEIFEALKHVVTMGRFEETLCSLQIQFSPFALAFVIISDSKEKE